MEIDRSDDVKWIYNPLGTHNSHTFYHQNSQEVSNTTIAHKFHLISGTIIFNSFLWKCVQNQTVAVYIACTLHCTYIFGWLAGGIVRFNPCRQQIPFFPYHNRIQKPMLESKFEYCRKRPFEFEIVTSCFTGIIEVTSVHFVVGFHNGETLNRLIKWGRSRNCVTYSHLVSNYLANVTLKTQHIKFRRQNISTKRNRCGQFIFVHHFIIFIFHFSSILRMDIYEENDIYYLFAPRVNNGCAPGSRILPNDLKGFCTQNNQKFAL